MIWVLSVFLLISVILNVVLFMYCRWASNTLKDFVERFETMQIEIERYRQKVMDMFQDDMFKYHGHKKIVKELMQASNDVLFVGNIMNDLIRSLVEAGLVDEEEGDEIIQRNGTAKEHLELEEVLIDTEQRQ